VLIGTSGADEIYGLAGNDLLDGGSGADALYGGAGDDTYIVDGGDTIYLSVIDKDGNIVSLIQSLYSSFGSGVVAPGTGIMLHNRGGLFTLDEKHPNVLAPRKRPLHTIIPAFMQKGDVKIGFGIMGGFNQAQAHAQFVADVADYGLDIQQALEAGRFTKASFTGRDVCVEALVPEPVHFTAAPLPATKTESSVKATLLKFLQIDSRNSRIAGRPLIVGVPIGSLVVPSSAKVLAKASASIARMARKYARTAREILSGATCSLI